MVCGSARVGRHLFSKASENSINQKIKAVMGKLGYDHGQSYSPHAFRCGGPEEIKDSVTTIDTIIKSGTWAAAGFRSY